MCVCVCVCVCMKALTIIQVVGCRLVGRRLGWSKCRQTLVLRIEGLCGWGSIFFIAVCVNIAFSLAIVWDNTPARVGGAKGGGAKG